MARFRIKKSSISDDNVQATEDASLDPKSGTDAETSEPEVEPKEEEEKEEKEEEGKVEGTKVEKKDNAKGEKGKRGKKKKKMVTEKSISGVVFMCNASTKQECFKLRVFGLPLAKKEVVERIAPGMKLFLFDVELRQMYGVYEASSPGGIDLEENAFKPTGSEKGYPAQVRFRISKDCLPVSEDVFRPAIKKNYFGRNKFRIELSADQVDNLLHLFRPLKEVAKEAIAKEKQQREKPTHGNNKTVNRLERQTQQRFERQSRPRFQRGGRSGGSSASIDPCAPPSRIGDFRRQHGEGRRPSFARGRGAPPPRPHPRSHAPTYAPQPVVLPRESYYVPTYASDPYPYMDAPLSRKRPYEVSYVDNTTYDSLAPKRPHLKEHPSYDYPTTSGSYYPTNYYRY